MTITPADPGVAAALAQALSHPGPYTEAECAALEGPLTIVHARDLADLRHFTGLRHLELHACAVRSLAPLTALTQLRRLVVLATPVEDLAPLRELVELTDLTLSFSHVTDATPLVGMPALARAELLGNPWTEPSYEQVLAEVARTPSTRSGTPPVLLVSERYEWETTRRMWDRGIAASVDRVDFLYWYLVRPGLPERTAGSCEAFRSDPVLIERALEDAPETLTCDQLFDELLRECTQLPRVDVAQLRSRREIGSSADALAWIEASALDAETKGQLRRFVERFPALSYYREPAALLDELEELAQLRFPAWLRELRQTLAWLLPCEPARDVKVRFARFELPGHAASDPGAHWYSIAPGTQSGSPPEGFMSIGFADDSWISALLIRSDDRRIYDFSEESYRTIHLEGLDVSAALAPVFSSYGAMLDAVDAIRVRDDEPILAR